MFLKISFSKTRISFTKFVIFIQPMSWTQRKINVNLLKDSIAEKHLLQHSVGLVPSSLTQHELSYLPFFWVFCQQKCQHHFQENIHHIYCIRCAFSFKNVCNVVILPQAEEELSIASAVLLPLKDHFTIGIISIPID